MRIAWVTNLAAPYRAPLWRHIGASHDLSVHLLALDEPGRGWSPKHVEGVSVSMLPSHAFRRGAATYYVSRRVETAVVGRDAVIIGGWESPSYWQIRSQARRHEVSTVGFYESTLVSQGFPTGPVARARATFLRSLDAVVVPGSAAAEAVLAAGVEPERIFIGRNAVDVNCFRAARVGQDASAGHRYLYVGQLIARKNVAEVLRGFALAARDGDRLSVVGAGTEHEALRMLAAQLGVSAQVEWHGHVDYERLPEVMARHHTLVLASTVEVSGLVVNEALAAGLHVVVSKQCGVAVDVNRMRGVYVVEPAVESIGRALATSARDWRGHIEAPEILAFSPEALADVFVAAARYATDHRKP